jgi:hypothetical protein
LLSDTAGVIKTVSSRLDLRESLLAHREAISAAPGGRIIG